MLFLVSLGAILLVMGLLTAWLAPRVGPNPLFGMRIGYAYASREVWDRTNRLGGLLFALAGLVTAAAGLILGWAGAPLGLMMTGGTVLMMALLLGSTVWTFLYARQLAQGTPIARRYAPLPFRWTYVAPVLLTYALLVAAALALFPQMPAAHMATHFGWNDQADGWMTRDGFLWSFLGITALFPALDLLVVFVATREPLIAFERWGRDWHIAPERGLVYTGLALALATLLMVALLVDVVWFNAQEAHLFPLSGLLWVGLLLVVVIVALFFYFARREPES